MHIGLILYGSLDTLSGGYLYDRQLVRCLEAHGDRVELISLPWHNYPLHLTDNWQPALSRRLLHTPFDILLQDELNHPSLAWLNGRLRGRVAYPVVSIVHHLRIQEHHPAHWMPLYRAVEQRYLEQVDGCIYNSETTRRAVETLIGRSPPHIVAWPAASHLPVLPRVPRAPGDPLRLLFIGNVIPRKGLATLLTALTLLHGVAWELQVAGDLELEPAHSHAMQKLAAEPRLQPRILFLGRSDSEMLQNALARADLLVVPSQHEGFGIVYLEALQAGVPVIATTGGAAWEMVEPGHNGFLIDPGDSGALATLLQRLATHPDELAALQQAAAPSVARFVGWEERMDGVRDWLLTLRGAR
jgi:glycosyltransferase involved in cell wall biosynthesis